MSLMEKLLYFLPCHNSLLLEESDQNEVQESVTKIQQLDFMHYSKISELSSWDNLPVSGLNQSERSIIRRNYCFHDGRVRVGGGANSKVEKKKCPRCSRWCKYYVTTSTTIIMCIGCGKKFDPRSNLSSSGHKLGAKSSLHRKQQDHQRLSLAVR
uniref:Uncharacterized protein n=1 Tax=Solanum tuberosum TaxID=4113 RepID=M1E171_SOLTU